MQNVGEESFTYDAFKAEYDTNPRVKNLVRNFSEKGIDLKTKKEPSDVPQADSQDGNNKVSAMAKRATDVGAKL